MNILETAFRIGGNVNVEHFFHSLVPMFGQVREVEVALENLLLQLVTKNHVKGIRQFIRFDSNQAG